MKSQNGKRWHIYSVKNISWWLILEWKVCCVAHSSCYVSSNDWSRVNMNHLLLWYDWFTFSKTVLTFPSHTHWKTFIFPRKNIHFTPTAENQAALSTCLCADLCHGCIMETVQLYSPPKMRWLMGIVIDLWTWLSRLLYNYKETAGKKKTR